MAIPSNPSITDIVTEGLKRGGRVSPSAGDITTASTIYLQEVKADLFLKAPRHSSLIAQTCIGTTQGISRYAWPTEAEALRSIQFIYTPSEGYWSSTAQTGGASSITLNALFTAASGDMIGRFVFLAGGTGVGQFAQITSYDDSTKIATIEAAWATLRSTWVSPNSTTLYVIESQRRKLWDYSKPYTWDTIQMPFSQGPPTWAAVNARQIWLDYTPDRVYAILIEYWAGLDQIDEALTLFTNHLRKFRNVWTQGVATKVMQRYDEDRYQSEMNIYNIMLDLYGAETAAVGQVTFTDV